ncbi:DUF1127 domain-containing protein [Phyllobacterium zundukense]|uniref:DUF1127 domain-containing protein n=1 Tax=Phyllobacterium zundukense TaxID=1867719 RepID=A0ACD4CXT5_9HYPH|nr:DUF1127 domain-containing protein [Phyllobacterium zundukense]UXN58422.1 DUF1127 domain-containing protein [Phyllobacterium zundukense]
MREAQAFVVDTLAATVDELCQKFGVWNTAYALILAIWRRHQTKNHISHLSHHMLRDIGLADSAQAPSFPLWITRPW